MGKVKMTVPYPTGVWSHHVERIMWRLEPKPHCLRWLVGSKRRPLQSYMDRVALSVVCFQLQVPLELAWSRRVQRDLEDTSDLSRDVREMDRGPVMMDLSSSLFEDSWSDVARPIYYIFILTHLTSLSDTGSQSNLT